MTILRNLGQCVESDEAGKFGNAHGHAGNGMKQPLTEARYENQLLGNVNWMLLIRFGENRLTNN